MKFPQIIKIFGKLLLIYNQIFVTVITSDVVFFSKWEDRNEIKNLMCQSSGKKRRNFQEDLAQDRE